MNLRNILISVLGAFVFFSGIFLVLSKPAESHASNEEYIVAGMESCTTSGERKRCMEELAGGMLDRAEIPEILEVFAAHHREPAFFNNCHEEAHYLGREAYKRIGSLVKVYSQSSEVCLGGVFHGALEGYFIANGLILGPDNQEEIRGAVSSVCHEVEAETLHSLGQCHHGLGHALMFAAEDSLPNALSLCDALEKLTYREVCYTGAFMQNVVNRNSVDHPVYMLKENDPMYPCNVLDERYKRICYTYAVLEQFQGDLQKGIKLCGSIPEEMRVECFRTLGRNAVMYIDEPVDLVKNCQQIEGSAYREACLLSSAGELLIRYDLVSPLSLEMCSLMDAELREKCFSELGREARRLVADESKVSAYCERIQDEPYQKACIEE
jgi:hypothetical protein